MYASISEFEKDIKENIDNNIVNKEDLSPALKFIDNYRSKLRVIPSRIL